MSTKPQVSLLYSIYVEDDGEVLRSYQHTRIMSPRCTNGAASLPASDASVVTPVVARFDCLSASVGNICNICNIGNLDFNGSRSDAEGKSCHHEDQKLHLDCLTVLQVTVEANKIRDKKGLLCSRNLLKNR